MLMLIGSDLMKGLFSYCSLLQGKTDAIIKQSESKQLLDAVIRPFL